MSRVDDFTGQRVLVTGGSSGIGAGMAEEFARRGAVVGICARRRDRLTEVLTRCQAHSPDSRMWVTDLADPAAVASLAASASEELGGVDVLVNDAGIPKRRRVIRLDMDTVTSVMNVNYFSAVNLTLALLPAMLAQKHGRIINVSSIAATLSSPGEAAYDASKAALTAFSEAMAAELWETGVKVLVVYPGLVDTELFSVPDNDPLPATPVTPIPVSEVIAAVFEPMERNASQVYVPAWFGDVAANKAQDLDTYLAGVAAFLTQQGSAGA